MYALSILVLVTNNDKAYIDVGFKFELHVCNKCHRVLTTAYELKNIVILNVKAVDFRCILWGISKNDAVNRLNNSVLEDRGHFINGFWYK